MLVSRVMSRKEYNNYIGGKTIRPFKGEAALKNRELREKYSDAYKHSEFEEGCIYFIPGDIRKMSIEDILDITIMAQACKRNGSVACVFEVKKERLTFGKALMELRHDFFHNSWKVDEAYLPSYNKKTAKLIAADVQFGKTVARAEEFKEDLIRRDDELDWEWYNS